MKRIAIIGASSGLGRRIAADFARMGWKVAAAARREEPLRSLRDEYPENIVYKTIDITFDSATERFYDLIEMNGGVDIVLIASGIGFQNPDLELNKEINVLETNVVGWTRIVNAAYKYFRDTRNNAPGRIAAITSVASTKGIGVAAAYSASKRFQRTYLEALEQLARRNRVNVRFTDIRPGFIRTPLLDPDKDYPMMMTVDYAAPLIELAIVRGQRVATVDWRWRLLCSVWRMIPRSWWVRMPVSLSEESDSGNKPTEISLSRQ